MSDREAWARLAAAVPHTRSRRHHFEPLTPALIWLMQLQQSLCRPVLRRHCLDQRTDALHDCRDTCKGGCRPSYFCCKRYDLDRSHNGFTNSSHCAVPVSITISLLKVVAKSDSQTVIRPSHITGVSVTCVLYEQVPSSTFISRSGTHTCGRCHMYTQIPYCSRRVSVLKQASLMFSIQQMSLCSLDCVLQHSCDCHWPNTTRHRSDC